MIAALALMASTPQVEAPPAAVTAPTAAPVAGAYTPLNVDAPQLRKPFRAAVAAITPQRNPGAKLLSAQHQVVAGINYRLTLKLRDGSRWQATVWRRLDGQLQVTETTRLD